MGLKAVGGTLTVQGGLDHASPQFISCPYVMAYSDALCSYLQGFARTDQAWPPPQPAGDPRLAWWRELPWEADRVRSWALLCAAMPQLRLPQELGISGSDLYRHLVLRGAEASSRELIPSERVLRQPLALQFQLIQHPYMAMPVLTTPDRHDFLWIVRALAHRAEPVPIENGVHAQAINGLIHWGLIQSLGKHARASLILLHEAPYGSVPAASLPISLDQQGWIHASSALRLEHELTHLSTKQYLGEMRLNLLDELIADAMGQLIALGGFSAEVFERCLQHRWKAYVAELEPEEAQFALELVRARARELEVALCAWRGPAAIRVRAELLPWLCCQRLDRPITNPAPNPLAKAD
jgi:hypothetical protein